MSELNNTTNNINNEINNGSPVNAPLTKKKKSKVWIIFVVLGVVLVALIVLGIFFGSRAIRSNNAKKEINVAAEYFDDEDYLEAIAHYKKAIEIDPTNIMAYEGIYNAYSILAQAAMDDGEYKTALDYYKDALSILKSGRDYIDSDELDEMIEDLTEGKKAAKEAYENGYVEPGQIEPDPEYPLLTGEEISAYTDMLNDAISTPGSDLNTLLYSMAVVYAHDVQNGWADESIVPRAIAGDPEAMCRWILPTAEHTGAYDFSVDWADHDYNPDTAIGGWSYTMTLENAKYAAYSICGQEVDLKNWDYQNSYACINFDTIDGTEYIYVNGGWAGHSGPILVVDSISSAEYIDDSAWQVVAYIFENLSRSDYDSIPHHTFAGEVTISLTPDPDSHYGFTVTNIHSTEIETVSWANLYHDFLISYKQNLAYSYGYATYFNCFLDSDDIPELLISDEMSDAYYVYTIKNGSVTEYIIDEESFSGSNCIFIASGVGGTSGSCSYIPYGNQLLLETSDADYAGCVYYFSTDYFDGRKWYHVSDEKYIPKDDNGNYAYQEIIDLINQGWLDPEEYHNTYEVPGYNPDADWHPFSSEIHYNLKEVY